MKNILLAVVFVVALNALFVFSGGLELLMKTEEKAAPQEAVHFDVIDTFRSTLEIEVQDKMGVPIEGYEPKMFLQVFPGLVETDFDGVEASIGNYIVVDGRLEHKLDTSKLIHSAATAISREGYKTLLNNIAKRIGVDFSNGGTITDVMSALTSEG
jgi:hypothetical protein